MENLKTINFNPHCSYPEYLSLPFFLNIAINSKSDIIKSYSEFIFKHTLKNIPKELRVELSKQLAEIAFRSYKSSNRFLINEEDVKSISGSIKAEEVILIRKEDGYEFEHQLVHEFFVAHKIASEPNKWNGETFDLVSLDNKMSYEIMQMTFEQIKTDKQGGLFLLSLYDWNFYSALHCIRHVDAKYPKQFARALVLVLSEKIFDRFLHTRTRVMKYLLPVFEKFDIKGLPDGFDEDLILQTANEDLAGTYQKMIEANKDYFKDGDYRDWYKLFSVTSFSESEFLINRINDPNPLIGWSCANVVRRFNFDLIDERQLRTKYGDITDPTIRWRVVHAMGNCKEQKSIQLLLKAVEENSFKWTTYGAVRSLVEIAFFKKDANEAEQILNNLIKLFGENTYDGLIIYEFRSCLCTKLGTKKMKIVNDLFNKILEFYLLLPKDEWEKAFKKFKLINGIESI